jgi:hypothetical protein
MQMCNTIVTNVIDDEKMIGSNMHLIFDNFFNIVGLNEDQNITKLMCATI